MRQVTAGVFLVFLVSSAAAYARMARCNVRRFIASRDAPPLTPGGHSARGATLPWQKSWQPWPCPADLDALEAQRYADLAAAKASARRVAAEVISVLAAACLGALLPAMAGARGVHGQLIGVGSGVVVVAIIAAYWLRQHAALWDRVMEIYDQRADRLERPRPRALHRAYLRRQRARRRTC